MDTPETDLIMDPDARAIESLTRLIEQSQSYEACRNILERVAQAKATLAETHALCCEHQERCDKTTADLATLEQTYAQKQQAMELRLEQRRAHIITQTKDAQAVLDRKQADLNGWTAHAQRQVAEHEQLITALQEKLAVVQAEYQQAVMSTDQAKASLASLVKTFAGAA